MNQYVYYNYIRDEIWIGFDSQWEGLLLLGRL